LTSDAFSLAQEVKMLITNKLNRPNFFILIDFEYSVKLNKKGLLDFKVSINPLNQ
jgi:hypothetical protein